LEKTSEIIKSNRQSNLGISLVYSIW